jgi:allantoin racemase
LKIPVVGPCEAAMLVAQLVGRKFAVVTVRPAIIPRMEEHLRLYGWESRAIKNRPIRHFDPWYWDACLDAIRGKPEKYIADFEKVALECINDGADTIIMGSSPASAPLTLAGYREIGNTGVPFISPAACAVKLAETMADLQQSIGLTKTEVLGGPYQTLPREMLVQMWKDFGF